MEKPFADRFVKSEVDGSLEYHAIELDSFCFVPNLLGVRLGDWLDNCGTRKRASQKR